MTSLADILPEPENGTVLAIDTPNGRDVIVRDDAEVADTRMWVEANRRWFNLMVHGWNLPLTWAEATKDATRAWSLGPLLADLEAER